VHRDVIELAAGLDPAARDSDRDGLPDNEEDTDHDTITNGLEWALTSNPANSFGFEGSADPWLLGARRIDREGDRPAASSPGRAWRLDGRQATIYSQPISDAKTRAATSRGWRLFLRVRPTRGDAFAGLDLVPYGRGFVINPVASDDDRTLVRLLRRASAQDAMMVELPAANRDSVLEVTYDAAVPETVFRVDGRRVRSGYEGLSENQVGWGVVWGTGNDAARPGEAALRFVLVEIRD
jgi:hypothetical protein